jgi:hypothetical protein
MGLSLAGVWIYATRRRFIPADMSGALIRDIRLNLLLPPLVFLLSAGVAAFSAILAIVLWFLLIPVYVLRRHTEATLMGRESP